MFCDVAPLRGIASDEACFVEFWTVPASLGVTRIAGSVVRQGRSVRLNLGKFRSDKEILQVFGSPINSPSVVWVSAIIQGCRLNKITRRCQVCASYQDNYP